jgi:hypothetical protein
VIYFSERISHILDRVARNINIINFEDILSYLDTYPQPLLTILMYSITYTQVYIKLDIIMTIIIIFRSSYVFYLKFFKTGFMCYRKCI